MTTKIQTTKLSPGTNITYWLSEIVNDNRAVTCHIDREEQGPIQCLIPGPSTTTIHFVNGDCIVRRNAEYAILANPMRKVMVAHRGLPKTLDGRSLE